MEFFINSDPRLVTDCKCLLIIMKWNKKKSVSEYSYNNGDFCCHLLA